MLHALTNDEMQRYAPSIFAKTPWDGVSDKYTFIPTIQILEAIQAEGFVPVKVNQSRSRIPGKSDFTKHMIRLQRAQDLEVLQKAQRDNPGHYFYQKHNAVAPEVAEIVLTNSHDRTSGYHLDAGIFRLLCSNGLTIKSTDFGSISVRHSGNVRDDVIDGCIRIVEDMPKALERIECMKTITLDRAEQQIFAAAAMELRYPQGDDGKATAPIRNEDLLIARRQADRASDLFTTLNVVQENFMKGGLRGTGTTGKRLHTRAINSVSEDIRLNKALWVLAEQMQALKA